MTKIAVFGNDEMSRDVAIALEIVLSGLLSSTKVVFNDLSDDADSVRKESTEQAFRDELIEYELLDTLDEAHSSTPIEITFQKLPQ